MEKYFLGIDIGSVSANLVAVTPSGEVAHSLYIRTNGRPIESVREGLRRIGSEAGKSEILGVGATGSGRQLTGILVGADVVKNEITAHATAALHYFPEARTVLEIGGQDSKIIVLRDQLVVDFAMNTVCAAGTGSFLDHQSERLGIPIEQFGDYALRSTGNVRIAGRCTVFAESDMISKHQFGFSNEDIIKGLCEALVRNYMNNLGRGRTLEPPYVFQGGVAANKGIVAAFEKELGAPVTVPKHHGVMGAIGAALLAAAAKNGAPSRFKGFEAADLEFKPSTFDCHDCSNQCEVIKVEMEGRVAAMWGDKCSKWSNSVVTN